MDNDLRQAVRALAQLTRLLERSTGGVGLAHYRVLAAIDEGDERASRLAARLALGKPTISASVEALTRGGLLVREDVPGDQRGVSLALTDRGRAVLAAAEEAMGTALRETGERVPAAPAAVTALARLCDALDEARGRSAAAR